MFSRTIFLTLALCLGIQSLAMMPPAAWHQMATEVHPTGTSTADLNQAIADVQNSIVSYFGPERLPRMLPSLLKSYYQGVHRYLVEVDNSLPAEELDILILKAQAAFANLLGSVRLASMDNYEKPLLLGTALLLAPGAKDHPAQYASLVRSFRTDLAPSKPVQSVGTSTPPPHGLERIVWNMAAVAASGYAIYEWDWWGVMGVATATLLAQVFSSSSPSPAPLENPEDSHSVNFVEVLDDVGAVCESIWLQKN